MRGYNVTRPLFTLLVSGGAQFRDVMSGLDWMVHIDRWDALFGHRFETDGKSVVW
jgi:hypothetical protein